LFHEIGIRVGATGYAKKGDIGNGHKTHMGWGQEAYDVECAAIVRALRVAAGYHIHGRPGRHPDATGRSGSASTNLKGFSSMFDTVCSFLIIELFVNHHF